MAAAPNLDDKITGWLGTEAGVSLDKATASYVTCLDLLTCWGEQYGRSRAFRTPKGGAIERQKRGSKSNTVSAFVSDQIELHGSGDGIIPLGPDTERSLRSVPGFVWDRPLGSGFARSQASYGRWLPPAHAHQQTCLPVGDLKLPIAAQQGYQDRQHRGRQPAGKEPAAPPSI